MIWQCITAYADQVTMRDVTHAGVRGRRCTEVVITGTPEAVSAWLAAEPTWRDDADRLDGIRAAMSRGLRVESREVKAIKVGKVEAVEINTREVYACISHADVAWYDPECPEYLYRPAPYRYEETCRRICRWAAKVGAAHIEAMTFNEFASAVAEVAGRPPVSQRQYVPSSREFDDDSWLDGLDALDGRTDLEPVPF